MANSVDPDETPHSAASHLGLNCLLMPVCPKIYGKYGISIKLTFTAKTNLFFYENVKSKALVLCFENGQNQ